MKISIRFQFLSLLTGLLLVPGLVKAQTTLVAGDLLFTSYNTNTSTAAQDSFSFVLLKATTSGTRINFSDRGYNSNANSYQAVSGLEGSTSWLSSTPIAAGTEVLITNNTALINGVSNGTVTVIDGTSITGYSITGTDQLFAYQNAAAPYTLTTSSTLISGIHWNRCVNGSTLLTTDAGWDPAANCSGSASASQLPTGLTAGTSALYMGELSGGLSVQEATFNCTGVPQTNLGTIRTNVYNRSNWTRNNAVTGIPATPSGCNFIGTPLPVSWGSFTGSYQKENVLLNWNMLAEQNITGYEVQRSEDGIAFQIIGRQKALGETESRSYHYIDYTAGTSPTYYYRLNSLELNGETQYSSTVRVTSPAFQDADEFRLIRNPVRTTIDLEGIVLQSSTIRVMATDLLGRITLQQEQPVSKGRQTVSFPATAMSEGQIYLLTVYVNGKVQKIRIIR